MIPQDVIDEMEQAKPVNASRDDVMLTKIIYSSPAKRSVVTLRVTYQSEPKISYDPDHLEDTGWYFPVNSVELVSGNRSEYENQISQFEYMTARNKG